MPITVNTVVVDDHVGDIKKSIQRIKELNQCTAQLSPYK